MPDIFSDERIPAAIEALLFVSDEPVSAVTIAKLLDINTVQATAMLTNLRDTLATNNRGIQLMEVAGGWQLCTHPEFHELLEAYVLSWDTRRLSAAALEVLAIVAYSQPVTRLQISETRGVSSDGALNTLIERGYVREAGFRDTPGNPILYSTTKVFLERYGLRSLDDLPPLESFAPDDSTARLINERLGGITLKEDDNHKVDTLTPEERTFDSDRLNPGVVTLSTGELIKQTSHEAFGVVEKVDFDQFIFDADDE